MVRDLLSLLAPPPKSAPILSPPEPSLQIVPSTHQNPPDQKSDLVKNSQFSNQGFITPNNIPLNPKIRDTK